jgi:PKD repeat protein
MYDTPGMYDVTLVSINAAGSDSITKEEYIEVRTAPAAPVSNDETVCFGETVPDLAAQGDEIQWYDDEALTNLVHTGATFATGQTEPGTYTYYVTQTSNGCESPYTMVSLTINALPLMGLEAFTPMCIDEPAFTLSGGTPEGGLYSGTGVSGDMFDPMTAGAGDHLITYTFEDANGCVNDTSQTITVFDLPVVTFDALADICVDEAGVTLVGGMPAGGTYSGTGVSSGMFDPMLAGVGTHTITYDYTDANGCSNMASQDITVNALPQPYIGADTAVCAGQDITLDATTTGGSSYEWYPGGETTASITVDSSGYGVGTHMFIAYVTDGNGCTGADTVMVEFKDCTGIGELAGINDIRLYPNPGQGEFTLQLRTSDPVDLKLDVYNNRGVKVYEEENIRVAGTEIIRMDLSNQPSGIYLVNLYNNTGKWIEKLIIRK